MTGYQFSRHARIYRSFKNSQSREKRVKMFHDQYSTYLDSKKEKSFNIESVANTARIGDFGTRCCKSPVFLSLKSMNTAKFPVCLFVSFMGIVELASTYVI